MTFPFITRQKVSLKIQIYLLVHMLLVRQLNLRFVLLGVSIGFDHNDLDGYHERQN
jgi:hypothetical protein